MIDISIDQPTRSRITVQGTVQGVGFRPFVYQRAHKCNLTGWVCNTSDGVLIEIEGKKPDILRFLDSFPSDIPPLAAIYDLQVEPVEPLGEEIFVIKHSVGLSEVRTTIPPDIATCPDCMADISTPGNRRFGYPFTNCTNCGPRFTIIKGVPYDRPNTTMSMFPMCPECEAEYTDPMDRRFHAQPNACPVCGPHLMLDGDIEPGDSEIISQAVSMLEQGDILAIKGLGGYHLACDARNTDAVRKLRQRKGRGGKPFALMCRDMDEVRRICEVDTTSETLLHSPERPIVLMPARTDSGISPFVASGITHLGIMLPYTPLHHILMSKAPATLVMTSGNLSEEPIVHIDSEVKDRLHHIADHILSNNRPIHLPCDDSVARTFRGLPMVLRRARGYVPRPIEMHKTMPQILACGGDLKSTFCVTKDKLALVSQHLGDLENVATMEHYKRAVDHFCSFFDVRPEIVAHDMHPGYHSTDYALSLGAPHTIAVQHHHAHIASCMAENRLNGPVLGVAFDGTGYGVDGNIWGSEFLQADYTDFRRYAHLAYVNLPGGDAAVRKPGRMALAYLLHTFGTVDQAMLHKLLPDVSDDEAYAVKTQIDRRINAPLTSSMGRLFDAVSALLGVCTEVTYEGQAAIELEILANGHSDEIYAYRIDENAFGELEIDVRPMIAQIVDQIVAKRSVGEIAGAFHSTIADIVARICIMNRESTSQNAVALSGGVFQNLLLLEKTIRNLERSGFEVYRHSMIPANDGGISIGQAAIAAGRYNH